jgi:hypothetical protein
MDIYKTIDTLSSLKNTSGNDEEAYETYEKNDYTLYVACLNGYDKFICYCLNERIKFPQVSLYLYMLRNNLDICEYLCSNNCQVDSVCYEIAFLFLNVDMFNFCLKHNSNIKVDQYFQLMNNALYAKSGIHTTLNIGGSLEDLNTDIFWNKFKTIFIHYGGTNNHPFINWFVKLEDIKYTIGAVVKIKGQYGRCQKKNYKLYNEFIVDLFNKSYKPDPLEDFLAEVREGKYKFDFSLLSKSSKDEIADICDIKGKINSKNLTSIHKLSNEAFPDDLYVKLSEKSYDYVNLIISLFSNDISILNITKKKFIDKKKKIIKQMFFNFSKNYNLYNFIDCLIKKKYIEADYLIDFKPLEGNIKWNHSYKYILLSDTINFLDNTLPKIKNTNIDKYLMELLTDITSRAFTYHLNSAGMKNMDTVMDYCINENKSNKKSCQELMKKITDAYTGHYSYNISKIGQTLYDSLKKKYEC